MLFIDVDNWYCQYQHVRAIILIVDIDNWNYRYLYYTYNVDRRESSIFGGGMASAVAQAYTGYGGNAPSGVQGLYPWLGGQGRRPPEADDIFAHKRQFKQ